MADGGRPALIDAHAHYVARWWFELDGAEHAQRHALISDLEALTGLSDEDAAVTRILSAPPEILYGAASTSDAQLRAHNEFLAATVTGRADLAAFGSVDAFGSDAVGQVAHAVDELGLIGVVVDSARRDLYLGDQSTWATFEAAAERNIPVFVHPVWTPDADALRERIGPEAAAWGRGYRNGVAMISLINSGVVKTFPELPIVVTGLAVGSLWFAHESIAAVRDDLGFSPHLYFDTTSFHAPSVRFQVDVLGVDRVVLGSDWPFHTDGTHKVAELTLASIGLSESDRDLVLAGSLRELIR